MNNIEKQERVLARIRQEIEPLVREEAEARRLWTLGYNKFVNAHKKIQERLRKNLTVDPKDKQGRINKTVQELWATMEGWDLRSQELTQRRDAARLAMEQKKQQIVDEEKILEKMLYEHQIQMQHLDGMVEKTFILNEGVVASLENMDKFLATDVFPYLSEKGTQKTIENSSSTKKIVIMSNTITIMDVSMVEEASQLIDDFVSRVNPKQEVQPQDEVISLLLELVKELLSIKIKVKAGPGLSKFLAMDIADSFPELKKAQKLLASATNYARSGLYVRLFTRETKDDKWCPVRQS